MVNNNRINHSHQARKHLVHCLRQQGIIQSERIAQAFLSIPRENFISTFFEQEELTWKTQTPDLYTPISWIETIYHDKPLVTWITDQGQVGSSTSAPTLIALMLEALAIQPGMSVLEIGTGSGYNAALLASLTGRPDLVTTIEVEDSLAQSARQKLETTVGPVSVRTGDGYNGVPLRAPYDRILATASSPYIPHAWYEQLAPGGRLVMDLQGSLHKSSFLVLKKSIDGLASGHFLIPSIHFLPMRSGPQTPDPTKKLLQQPTIQFIVRSDDHRTALLFEDAAFHWFLQWSLPGLTLTKTRTKAQEGLSSIPLLTFIDGKEETIIRLYLRNDTWAGYERGRGGLWQNIILTAQRWQEMGRPDQSAFRVEWDQQRARFRLLYTSTIQCSFDI